MLKSTLALALLSLASQVQAAEYGILDMASFKLSVVVSRRRGNSEKSEDAQRTGLNFATVPSMRRGFVR